MTIKRLSLTAFFVVLTLSVGLVSVNFPLTVKGQNSALSQDGDGTGEQNTEQVQSSKQDIQVVSGDSSVLSGNNLQCQDQNNSDALPAPTEMCNLSEMIPPSIPPGTLGVITNSNGAGRLIVTDEDDQSVREAPFKAPSDQNRFQITRDHSYTLRVVPNSPSMITFESAYCLPAVPPSDFCGGVMKLPVVVVNVVIR